MARRKQLRTLSLDQLLELRDAVTGWVSKKAAAAREEIEAKLAALGGHNGGARSARASARVSKFKGRKVPPKYRNPKNRSETWAGRGAMPRWLRTKIKAGKKLEQFAIKKPGRKKAT